MLFLTWGSSLCGLPPCTESSRLLLELPPWNYTWNIFINYPGDEYFLRYFWNYVFPSLPPRSFFVDFLNPFATTKWWSVIFNLFVVLFIMYTMSKWWLHFLFECQSGLGLPCSQSHCKSGKSAIHLQTPTSFASRLIILLGWWSVLVVQYR